MSEVSTKRPNVVVLFSRSIARIVVAIVWRTADRDTQHRPTGGRQFGAGKCHFELPGMYAGAGHVATGRYPQTTGHLINDPHPALRDLGGDAFGKAGYKTAWVGKWHLHTGLWPALDRMPQHPDWVPEGRGRLSFDYWRAYTNMVCSTALYTKTIGIMSAGRLRNRWSVELRV